MKKNIYAFILVFVLAMAFAGSALSATETFKLNDQGKKYIEVRKCNFDVEIGRDMLLDYERNKIDNYVLWSGDSDFADPVNQLVKDGKKVVIFATSRRISLELAQTQSLKYDIQKIRNFICFPSELPQDIKSML